MTRRLSIALLAATLLSVFPAGARAGDIPASVEKAVKWISTQQNPDGGFGPYGEQKDLRLKDASDVGITAFAVYALAKSPPAARASLGSSVSRAVDFLLSKQQKDGGFYDPKDATLQNYKTCVTLLALNALDRAKHADAIQKAQAFIKAQQFDEDDGYKPGENLMYGGITYGPGEKRKADLSNTQFGLEALAESGVSGSEELWKKAVVYIARCQNAKAVEPILADLKIGTTGDGGFRYSPGDTRGPQNKEEPGPRIFPSYGSMTYAALKSLLYANVSKKDPMVRDAFAWISTNYTVLENPGMATSASPKAGLQGLFCAPHGHA